MPEIPDINISEIQIPAIVGTVLSLVISVVVRSYWPGWVKGVVVIGSSLVAGFASAWITGRLTGANWIGDAFVIGAFAVASYKGFWQPTGIGPAIERATQPAAAVPTNTATK